MSSLRLWVYKAILGGNMDVIGKMIDERPNIIRSRITSSGETALMVAIKGGQTVFAGALIGLMSEQDLALTDNSGNTALHTAAMLGNILVAEVLLSKNPSLINARNKSGMLPAHVALLCGHKYSIMHFLYTAYNNEDMLKNEASSEILASAIRAGILDFAAEVLARNQRLAWECDDQTNSPLQLLAGNPIAFPSRSRFNFWQSLIYRYFSPKDSGEGPGRDCYGRSRFLAGCRQLLATLWEKVGGPVDRLHKIKYMHRCTLNILNFLCSTIEELDVSEASSKLKEPFLLAVQNGIEEIVTEILDCYPDAVKFKDKEGHSVFHIAVMYRYENIFKIACQKNLEQDKMVLLDNDCAKNNILHLAGYRARQDRLDLNGATVLQMQSELKWFKELEKLVPLEKSQSKNEEGKTPLMIFHEEHYDMASNETQWVTSMATACSVAASIIATVAFAAAITVPGGNNSDNGLPLFSNHKSFRVFAVSNALALFSSIVSLLTFLSIFTSRFGVNDFLYALPNRLIIGLSSLLLSIISLMLAFASILFLVFAQKNRLFLIPVITGACAPVVLYAFLQLPSFLNMIKTTYFNRDFLVPNNAIKYKIC